MMMRRKLACFGLAFALAELLAAQLPPLAVLLTAVCCIGSLILLRHKAVRIVLFGAAFGLCYSILFWFVKVRPLQVYDGQTVFCTARIETDASTSYNDGMLGGTLTLFDVDGNGKNLRVHCSAFPGIEAGELFEGTFLISEPADDAYRNGRYAKGVYLSASYEGDYSFLGTSNAPHILLWNLRKFLSRCLSRYIPPELAALEKAMLLGDKSGLTEETKTAFQKAGISHLLAVSGLHLMLLCGIFNFAGKKKRFWRPAIICRSLLALFYMLLVGLPVSVLRAGLVFLIALLGDFFLQPADLLTSTGAAAVLLGLQNGYAPCDLGFQLSFAALLGVQLAAALQKHEQLWLSSRNGSAADQEEQPESKTATIKEQGIGLLLALLGVAQVAIFAGLFTLPVLLLHSMTASGAAVISNILVVWMVQPALLLGMLILAFSILPVLSPLAHGVSLVLAFWLRMMLTLTEWCADLPFARLHLPVHYTLWVLFLLGVLGAAFYMMKCMKYYPVALVLCLAAAVPLAFWMQKDVVEIALVGTAGNPCAVIVQNQKAAVLFRGGSKNWQAVKEYLEEQGSVAVSTVVDLRQSSSQVDFEDYPTLSLTEAQTSLTLSDTMTLDLYHNSSANVAVLNISGYAVGMMAGNARLSDPIYVDVFCAGRVLSDDISARNVIVTTLNPEWTKEWNNTKIFYGEDTPEIVVRPEKSAVMQGVTSIAVQ